MAIREINDVLNELYETNTSEDAAQVLKTYVESVIDETALWIADDPFKQLQIVNKVKQQII